MDKNLPKLPKYPSLYQINTRILFTEKNISSLDQLEDSFFIQLQEQGFDYVYLLGVWQTGFEGAEVSQLHPSFEKEFKEALPDVKDEDIVGSPFAITHYTLHKDFGTLDSLKHFRKRLHEKGIRLILDFVPNHVALDHPWSENHLEYFIQGNENLLRSDPSNWVYRSSQGKSCILAHGRDPYYPGWPDTLQLNYFHPEVKKSMSSELIKISNLCDGVRCDMAMLVVPRIFRSTWIQYIHAKGYELDESNFWETIIPIIKKQFPEFIFIAEVYWDMEHELQTMGFDFTYDKKMYDRLKSFHSKLVIEHLWATPEFQMHSVRFLENHDEPRAASVFPLNIHKAAAVITRCVAGSHFYHNGEFEGFKIRTSIHLKRKQKEEISLELKEFYDKLLHVTYNPIFRDGQYRLIPTNSAWNGNISNNNFVNLLWYQIDLPDHIPTFPLFLVVVNYSMWQSQGYIPFLNNLFPSTFVTGKLLLLEDLMSNIKYERQFDEILSKGFYVDLFPYGYHIFRITFPN